MSVHRIRGSAAATAVAVGALAALTAVAVGGLAALTACGGDDGRAAASVSASQSGTVVTDSSDDLGSIIIGWGEQHSDNEITTPKPEDVTARCFGNGDDLAVEISAPHGWIIKTSHPSQVLTVENTDQGLSGDIDTTNKYLDSLRSVDWSQPDQLDIAATAAAPQDWNSPYGTGRVYLSVHIDCTQ